MARTSSTDRKPITSDPDRGVAVNSGTDPQRPGKPARAVRDISTDNAAPVEDSAAGQRPAARGNDDVEHGGRNEPDDPV